MMSKSTPLSHPYGTSSRERTEDSDERGRRAFIHGSAGNDIERQAEVEAIPIGTSNDATDVSPTAADGAQIAPPPSLPHTTRCGIALLFYAFVLWVVVVFGPWIRESTGV